MNCWLQCTLYHRPVCSTLKCTPEQTIFQWLVKLYCLAGLVQLQPIRTSSGPSLAHHLHLGPNKTFLLHSYLVIFELALESLEYTDTGFYLLFNVEYTIHPSLMSLLTCRHVKYGKSRSFFLLQKPETTTQERMQFRKPQEMDLFPIGTFIKTGVFAAFGC